jgi:SAM-dependent methyltransferase
MKHADLSPVFLGWLIEEGLEGKGILDLGCGNGRLTFALAPQAGLVVGLDRDEDAIRGASARAKAEGVANVRFVVSDVEAIEYDEATTGVNPNIVTAHLCMSDAMIERAGRVLTPGAPFAFVALHKNQWKETDHPSRYSYTEKEVAARLVEAGFTIEHGRVEEEVVVFRSAEEAARILLQDSELPMRWSFNERREEGLRAYLQRGGKEITRKGHVLVLARKAA